MLIGVSDQYHKEMRLDLDDEAIVALIDPPQHSTINENLNNRASSFEKEVYLWGDLFRRPYYEIWPS